MFSHDDDTACQSAKIAFIHQNKAPKYRRNKPLTQLITEFSAACETNYRNKGAEPSDPLTHAKVLDIFQRALAMEGWPTTGDHAILYDVLEVTKPRRQRGSRMESNIESSRSSDALTGVESFNNRPGSQQENRQQALPDGLSNPNCFTEAVWAATGRRKRSREARETTESVDDEQSDEERSKRTRKKSKHHDVARAGRKDSRVRRRK